MMELRSSTRIPFSGGECDEPSIEPLSLSKHRLSQKNGSYLLRQTNHRLSKSSVRFQLKVLRIKSKMAFLYHCIPKRLITETGNLQDVGERGGGAVPLR
jgi:hypothetical protein